MLAVVTVDTLDDSVNLGDGYTSLREAIFATNTVPGPDTINFAPALTANGPAKILLTGGSLSITDSLTIDGPAANLLTIDANSIDQFPEPNPDYRAFDCAKNTDVTLADLTITGGSVSNSGGGVRSFGTLTVERCLVIGNHADLGGGLFNYYDGLTVIDSTIAGNSATNGGGISGQNISIVNSTIGGNHAASRGGGITIYEPGGQVTITQSTITGNTADTKAGGIYRFAAANAPAPVLVGSIVAGNFRSGSAPDDLGVDVDASYCIIGTGTGVTITDNGGNQIGSDAAPLDPKLGPLADNGGPTPTHALMPGSPALDAGDPAAVAGADGVPMFDQRGTPFTRAYDIDGVGGPRIDIGAYEAAPFTLVVDTLADESDGDFSAGDFSLREAIEFANSHAGHDTINFARSLTAGGPATILLTHGELAITDAVTINGPGADLLTIDASGNDLNPRAVGDGSRIFSIFDYDIIHAFDAQISGLTLTGGDADGNGGAITSVEQLTAMHLIVTGNHTTTQGGAISISTSGPFASVISDCTITNNVADGSGGGIFDQSGSFGTVRISDNTISGNMARIGGAIYVGGSAPGAVTISNNKITENTASQQGGAIYLSASTAAKVTVSQSTISGNTAGQQGGGLFIRNARDLLIEGSTIANNKSTATSQSQSRGGGIYNSGGDIGISACTIAGNMAFTGGGIWSQGGELAVNFSAIEENTATGGDGGGIQSGADRLAITGSTISGNAASLGRGGGLFHVASPLAPTSILDSSFTNNLAGSAGGGIYWSPQTSAPLNGLTLTDVNIGGNMALRGGGLATGLTASTAVGSVVTNGGSISGNSAKSSGGGVYMLLSSFTANGTTISGNHAGNNGGGVALPPTTSLTTNLSFVGATISGNIAGGGETPNQILGNGGGLWIPSGSVPILLSDTTISGNAAGRGAGIFRGQNTIASSLVSIGSTISGNVASLTGGGFYNLGGSLSFTRTAITGNIVTGTSGLVHGGGIFNRGADLSLINSSLSGNSSANGRGGGLYMAQSGDLTVTGSTIAGNFARIDGGGVWLTTSPNDRTNFLNSTVSGNSSQAGTGGLRLQSTTTIRKSTVINNSGSGGSANAGGVFVGSSPLELDHTIIAKNIQANSVTPDLGILNPSTVTVRFSLIGDDSGSTLAEAKVGSPDVFGNLIGKPIGKGGSGVIDAKLGALTNNGGPTWTHALLPGSPAIDAGAIVSGSPLGFDQRGAPFSRMVDGNSDGVVRIDIGAYESQGVSSFAPGDYNRNGVVDTVDYVLWRDALGHEGPAFSGADGNGNGRVDQADYDVWASHFGQTLIISPPTTGGGAATAGAPASTLRSTNASEVTRSEPITQSEPAPRSARLSSVASLRSDAALLAWLSLQPGAAHLPSAALSNSDGDGKRSDDSETADAADAAWEQFDFAFSPKVSLPR